mmetsp:Transcript_48385/g.121962  ORF Transcript_48385/g.121962 Transcript_48385/m.121962 type:complete len:211 (-) Transcript_48385:1014-1646(-)
MALVVDALRLAASHEGFRVLLHRSLRELPVCVLQGLGAADADLRRCHAVALGNEARPRLGQRRVADPGLPQGAVHLVGIGPRHLRLRSDRHSAAVALEHQPARGLLVHDAAPILDLRLAHRGQVRGEDALAPRARPRADDLRLVRPERGRPPRHGHGRAHHRPLGCEDSIHDRALANIIHLSPSDAELLGGEAEVARTGGSRPGSALQAA